MADRVRGHRAVLRQGRAADWRLRRHRRFRRRCRAASSCSRRRRRAAASGCCRRRCASSDIPVVAGPPRQHDAADATAFPPCHYCGNCGAGCDTASFFCSADHLLPFALKTGTLEIRSNAVVGAHSRRRQGPRQGRAVLRSADRRRSARCSRRSSSSAPAAWTRRASCSTRSPTRHPNGIGNGSDVIGRYLCEQIRLHVTGFLPALVGDADAQRPRHRRRAHLHAALQPSARPQAAITCAASARSSGTPARAPAARTAARERIPGFGADVEDGDQAAASGVGRDPSVRRGRCPTRTTGSPSIRRRPDRYGVPLLKIDYQIGENERKMTEHMADTVEEIVQGGRRRAGRLHARRARQATARRSTSTARCRMGADPKRSALNAFNQMHEVKNVFVVDGSAFTTATEKNPTLTILALSWRATDYLAERDQARQSLMESDRCEHSTERRGACGRWRPPARRSRDRAAAGSKR